MIYLSLPNRGHRRLAFFLAMEEWAASALPAEEYFFSWRVEPTVICGRNQEIDKEIDLRYCYRNGIDIVRRRSGGGAVYADRDNFMFSYIAPSDSVQTTFSRYTLMVSDMLCSLGINAEATGRNDIMIKGRKVSGNAFYHLPGRAIAHGTMLYHFNPKRISRVLTPSRAKLESKGVKSVPSHVTSLINEGLRLGHEEFEAYAINHLCSAEREITAAEIKAIENIEEKYYDPQYLYGHKKEAVDTPEHTCIERTRHLEGIGEFSVRIYLNPCRNIHRVNMSGDYFLTGDPQTAFLNRMQGIPYTRQEITDALSDCQPAAAIPNLEHSHLIDLLID